MIKPDTEMDEVWFDHPGEGVRRSHLTWSWAELTLSSHAHVSRFGERWFLFACDGLEPQEVHSFDAALMAMRITS